MGFRRGRGLQQHARGAPAGLRADQDSGRTHSISRTEGLLPVCAGMALACVYYPNLGQGRMGCICSENGMMSGKQDSTRRSNNKCCLPGRNFTAAPQVYFIAVISQSSDEKRLMGVGRFLPAVSSNARSAAAKYRASRPGITYCRPKQQPANPRRFNILPAARSGSCCRPSNALFADDPTATAGRIQCQRISSRWTAWTHPPSPSGTIQPRSGTLPVGLLSTELN